MNQYPSDKILKQMGYFSDQEGIMSRYINEESNWKAHLSKTKEFIKDCIIVNHPENVAILGSGWLLDVPFDFLSRNCKNIYLYDIRHPSQIVHQLKKYPNIKLVNCDITGGAIVEVYTIMYKNISAVNSLKEIKIPGFEPKDSVDYIISVNILNQLDNLILEYLRHFKIPDSPSIKTLQQNIQVSHLQSLQKYNACLITDYEELLYDRADNLIATNPLLFCELPKAKKKDEWLWHFDTQMTYYPNRKTIFKVIALQF